MLDSDLQAIGGNFPGRKIIIKGEKKSPIHVPAALFSFFFLFFFPGR